MKATLSITLLMLALAACASETPATGKGAKPAGKPETSASNIPPAPPPGKPMR